MIFLAHSKQVAFLRTRSFLFSISTRTYLFSNHLEPKRRRRTRGRSTRSLTKINAYSMILGWDVTMLSDPSTLLQPLSFSNQAEQRYTCGFFRTMVYAVGKEFCGHRSSLLSCTAAQCFELLKDFRSRCLSQPKMHTAEPATRLLRTLYLSLGPFRSAITLRLLIYNKPEQSNSTGIWYILTYTHAYNSSNTFVRAE